MKTQMLRPSFVISLLFILLIFPACAFAQVGINTTSPTTSLDVDGALSLRESPDPLVLVNGPNARIELGTVPYSQYRITGPSAPFSIRSIVPVGPQADGQIVRLINTTSHNMTLLNGGSIGISSLEIFCPGAANLLLSGINSSVTLQYSKGLSRWTVVGNTTGQSITRITAIGTTDIARQNSSWHPLMD